LLEAASAVAVSPPVIAGLPAVSAEPGSVSNDPVSNDPADADHANGSAAVEANQPDPNSNDAAGADPDSDDSGSEGGDD